VIVLTLLFAWRYRQSNTAATYLPDWHHSARLEMVIWAAPLAIILVLGAVTWKTTHLLDPYRPLSRLAPGQPLAPGVKPLRVQVVALDWKWLFIYPDLGVATVNQLAAPVNTPIDFTITANSVMNSFSVPALAGQVYAMPGMQTRLHAVINKPGDYAGFSANYSGAGFSGMRFGFHGLSQADFDRWVAAARAVQTERFRELGLVHVLCNAAAPANVWLPRQTAELKALDKVSTRVADLSVRVGTSVGFGSLTIAVRACVARPPDQAADAAAWLDITDSHPDAPQFHGWMVLSAPMVSMLQHPVYDVRLSGCR